MLLGEGNGRTPMDSISWSMVLAPCMRPLLYRLSLTIATISSISILLKDMLSIGIVVVFPGIGGGDIVIPTPGMFVSYPSRFLTLRTMSAVTVRL